MTNTKAVRGIVVCKAWFAGRGALGRPARSLGLLLLIVVALLRGHLDELLPVSNEGSTAHGVKCPARGCRARARRSAPRNAEARADEGCTFPLEALNRMVS